MEVNNCNELSYSNVLELSEGLLEDAREVIDVKKTFKIPIGEMAILGSSIAALVPKVNTITQTIGFDTTQLFKLANASTGDALKIAKNGNYWGALKTPTGESKFAQFKAAGPLSATSTIKMVAPIDPTTIMLAATLYSIEKKLDKIEEMEKEILRFLEIEKESEIEADIKTLTDIIKKFKYNWENEHFLASNHKMVLDIQRTARKNVIFYQKKVEAALTKTKIFVAQAEESANYHDLEKKFKYYRLSVYSYSLASFLEILLSGNFSKENISCIRNEIESLSNDYRELFSKGSQYIENTGKRVIESHLLKGVGSAGEAVGKFIGSIPLIKESSIDEFLQGEGADIQEIAEKRFNQSVQEFAKLNNPGVNVFTNKMNDLVNIFNHTAQICFDKENIYLSVDE